MFFFLLRPFLSKEILCIIFINTFVMQIIYLLRYTKISFIKSLLFINNKFVQVIYKKPLLFFYENILKNIPGIGDLLLLFCNIFFKLYTKIGTYAIIINCIVFFIVPNILLSFLILINVFFSLQIIPIYFIILFLFIRIMTTIYFILCDFCLQNKAEQEIYLIVKKTKDNKYIYDLNRETVKNPTQEKLNLYSSRHFLFTKTYSFLQSTLDYKNNIIKPWLEPLLLSVFLTSNLKVICKLFEINTGNFIFIAFFLFIFIKEKYNIYYETSCSM
jgi:hypothetical protein